MITINVNVTDHASPALAALLSSITGQQATLLNEAAGWAASEAAAKYHREFEAADRWRGTRYLGPSNGSGSFGAAVAQRWKLAEFSANGATISNDSPFYRHKVEGGTIRPKRGKALTIPLIPEARGILASDYQRNSGKDLFTIKGKNALFERIATITAGARGRRGQAGATPIRGTGIRAVYALVSSITQGPWPGAVPPSEAIAAAYTAQYRASLIAQLI